LRRARKRLAFFRGQGFRIRSPLLGGVSRITDDWPFTRHSLSARRLLELLLRRSIRALAHGPLRLPNLPRCTRQRFPDRRFFESPPPCSRFSGRFLAIQRFGGRGTLREATHSPTTRLGLTSRRVRFFRTEPKKEISKKESNMKSILTAIAVALVAVGSLQAAGSKCPECCKDKDCATCCKGKCDECKNCNK
jgi:hypothetical protein